MKKKIIIFKILFFLIFGFIQGKNVVSGRIIFLDEFENPYKPKLSYFEEMFIVFAVNQSDNSLCSNEIHPVSSPEGIHYEYVLAINTNCKNNILMIHYNTNNFIGWKKMKPYPVVNWKNDSPLPPSYPLKILRKRNPEKNERNENFNLGKKFLEEGELKKAQFYFIESSRGKEIDYGKSVITFLKQKGYHLMANEIINSNENLERFFYAPPPPPPPPSGGITGMVTSEEGGRLPGVMVTIRGPSIGTRTTTTSTDGKYRFLDLPPGSFDITFELAGFKTKSYKDIRLSLGKTLTLNIVIDIMIKRMLLFF